jgi:hypothetical protein
MTSRVLLTDILWQLVFLSSRLVAVAATAGDGAAATTAGAGVGAETTSAEDSTTGGVSASSSN